MNASFSSFSIILILSADTCGKHNITYSEKMCCSLCYPFEENNLTSCSICGKEITSPEAFFISKQNTIVCLCETCKETHTQSCLICNGSFFKNEIHYDEQCHGFICNTCDKIIQEKEEV